MHKRIAIGLIVLIFVLGVAIVFYHQYTDIQQLKEELAADQKKLEGNDKPVAEKELPPADPGYKWVPHDDHFHQVPIDAPDVWRAEPTPVIQSQPVSTVPAEVIYPHQELLDTHPVAALRQQAKDSGHWSAKYIPPFPPDDVEANELARAYYIDNYFRSRNDFYNPHASEARKIISKWNSDYRLTPMEYKESRPRHWDLFRLSWTEGDPGTGEFAWPNLNNEIESNFTREEYENAYNSQ